MAKKILIVDDEPDMVEMLKARLGKKGYNVIGAIDGEEGLKKAASEKPDLILLDVLMPGISGFEMCEHLKGDPKTSGIPVVMLTALLGDPVKEKGLAKGAKYFISKPYDPEDLLWVIEDALKNRRPFPGKK